jgi:diaminopimelate epimerase
VKQINFNKYQACGNDFVIIDNTLQNITLTNDDIRFICNRHLGIGCDQLLIISRMAENNFKYDIFNQDGSEAFQCLNGARCVINFIAREYQLVTNNITLYTKNQKYTGQLSNTDKNNVILNLNPPLEYSFLQNYANINYDYIDVGNPHVVIYLNDTTFPPSQILHRTITSINAKYKNGINVNFYIKEDNNTIRMLTHENGVGITFSCGSGAYATVYSFTKGIISTTPITVITNGGSLIVDIKQQIKMIGPSQFVFEGSIVL